MMHLLLWCNVVQKQLTALPVADVLAIAFKIVHLAGTLSTVETIAVAKDIFIAQPWILVRSIIAISDSVAKVFTF